MNVFVSYSSEDDNKRLAVGNALKAAVPRITPVVVAARREPGRPLADKVIACIEEADVLVPILTRSSIHTQWVNQEIGYAHGIGKPVIPLVERQIIGQLKGFIHNQHDLPFSFEGFELDARREAAAFRSAYRLLIDHLQGQRRRQLSSTISPRSVVQGERYSTTVSFQGSVLNGFFDNYVVHLDSKFTTWNWDPETIPPESGQSSPSNNVAGTLNGSLDITKTYSHSTVGWPVGRYKILVRLYSHLVPGRPGRSVVAENEHHFEVTAEPV